LFQLLLKTTHISLLNAWIPENWMIWLIVTYLLLGGIGLSFWHSYRVIRSGGKPGAPVNEILAGRREKRLLMSGLILSGCYAVAVFALSLFQPELAPLIVLTPFIYLIIWSVPRLFLRGD